MASISMGDLKKGLKIEINGTPYKIVEYQHVKPGKGAAFVRCKIKSFMDGKVIEKTFHAGDKCETPNLEDKIMQFLYDDGEFLQFMDSATYEQIALTHDQVGEAADWIIDGMNVDMLYHNGQPISVEAPQFVELKIVETPPNFKGDTQGGKKPATLESGAVVQVPFHVVEGDVIKVDTVRGEYLEKSKIVPKVLLPLAIGFEEIEAITIVDILRRASVEVVMGSLEGLHVKGAHGIEVIADSLLCELEHQDFDMIVLPGGLPGATNLAKDSKVQSLLQDFDKANKHIAAICAAPLALKSAGVLKNHYTCYPSFENQIKHQGYNADINVVCDANITTSKGPSTAIEFTLKLVEILCGEEMAQKLSKDLLLIKK